MSATARGAERVQHDAYPTPAWVVRRLLDACPLPSGVWLEPCAGEGAIIAAANEGCATGRHAPFEWSAIELRAECHQALVALVGASSVHTGVDYLEIEASGADVIITNPPFEIAFEIAQKALTEAPVVALLLRLNWLASDDRAAWLHAHTPSVYVLPNRPSFCGSIRCSNRKLCEWQELMPLAAVWPRACPLCSAKTTRTTSDATDYAWFVWGVHDTPRLVVLPTTPKAERLACTKSAAA